MGWVLRRGSHGFAWAFVLGITLSIGAIAAPEWQQSPLDLGIQNEGRPWIFQLRNAVHGPNSARFEATGLPPWMTLNPETGTLSGTPKRQNVGPYDGIILTAIDDTGSVAVDASGEVLKTLTPPTWVGNEIVLDAAREEYGYSAALRPHISNPEPLDLRFALVSTNPPPWVRVSATTGAVFGTPPQGTRGSQARLRIRMSAQVGSRVHEEVVTVLIPIVGENRAPIWTAGTLTLPNALSNVPYEQALGSAVSDPDGDSVTFTRLSGPEWAEVDPETGFFSGTPSHADAGRAEWVISATDIHNKSTRVRVRLLVTKSNEAPIWEAETVPVTNAQQGRHYHHDLGAHVRDPDKDTLTFTLLSGPDWLKINAGVLLGKPQREDVGPVRAQVFVDDGRGGHAKAWVSFFVEPVNQAPYWILKSLHVHATEGQSFELDLSAYSRDPDEDPLRFGVVQTAGWGTLSAEGLFTGIPPRPSGTAKSYYQFRAIDPHGLGSTVEVWIHVQAVDQAPGWQDPVQVPAATEDRAYQASLVQFVTGADSNRPLRFEKVGSTPTWLSVSAEGLLYGTPRRVHAGTNAVHMRVFSAQGLFSEASFNIEVRTINQPPRWRQQPLFLGDAVQHQPFAFNLALYAVDPDNDPIQFELVSGPGWMVVGTHGEVSGRPREPGPFQAVFRAKDRSDWSDVPAEGIVVRSNRPPVVHANWPVLEVLENETLTAWLNSEQNVSDPDGDTLNFMLQHLSPWVELTPQGLLTARPTRAHRGDHSFAFTIDDGKASVVGAVRIRVIPNPAAPHWTLDPIERLALTHSKLEGSVANHVQDASSLRFQMVPHDSWLVLSPDGSFSGTPSEAQLGSHTFTVTACNDDKKCSDTRLVVNVTLGARAQQWTVGELAAGLQGPSAIEILWLMDPSSRSKALVDAVRAELPTLTQTLKAQGVQLITTQTPTTAGMRAPDGVQSPLWTLFAFLNRANDSKNTVGLAPHRPQEVVLVTRQRDAFRWFSSRHANHASIPISRYLAHFPQVYANATKPWRVSAIAPSCPQLHLAAGCGPVTLDADHYRRWVNETGGILLDDGCKLNARSWLGQLESRAAFWARLNARGTITLSDRPLSPDTLEVSLGGKVLDSDEWSYDEAGNQITVHWSRINTTQLKPDTELQVKYH